MKSKINHFLIFFMMSYVLSQMLPYMKQMINHHINYLFSIGALMLIVIQLLITYYGKSIKVIYFLFFITSIMYYYLNQSFLWILSFLLSFALLKVMINIDEVIMLEEGNYGILRAYGAIGMMSGAIVAGYLFADQRFYLLTMIIVGIVCGVLIKDYHGVKKQSKLIINSQFIYYLIVFLLIYVITSLDQYLVIEKMIALKASKEAIGWKWAVQAFFEIPSLFLLDKIAKKIDYKKLLCFAIIMYFIKFMGYSFFQNNIMIILCASLQVFTLPIVNYTSKYLIKKVSYHSNKNQMIASLTFQGVALMIAPILSTFLIQWVGYNMSLALAAASLLVLGIFVISYKNN